jgi:hypothetical protein
VSVNGIELGVLKSVIIAPLTDPNYIIGVLIGLVAAEVRLELKSATALIPLGAPSRS